MRRRGPGAPLLARSANACSRDQVDDREQDHGAEERHQQAARAELTRIDRRRPDQGPDQPATQHRADDSDHDVEDDALAGVAPHHDAREPTDYTANNQPQDDSHVYLLSLNGL